MFLYENEEEELIKTFWFCSFLITPTPFFSWDSMGCESGIVLRESAERDDASRNVELLDGSTSEGVDDAADNEEDARQATPIHRYETDCEIIFEKKKL